MTEYDVETLSQETVEALDGYGVEVNEPTLVEVHPDGTAAPGRESARGGYSPALDMVQLYEPLFDSGASVEDALVHEYVHKHQADTAAGSPDDAYQEAVRELDACIRDYGQLLESFDHVEDRAEARLGVGAITDTRNALGPTALDQIPDTVADLTRLAKQEYAAADTEEEQEAVVEHLEEAIRREHREHAAPIRLLEPVMDRSLEIPEGACSSPAQEAAAYYAGIAVNGHIDDQDYIDAELDEVRSADRDYDEPERQAGMIEDLIEEHRARRDEGQTDDEAITAILERML